MRYGAQIAAALAHAHDRNIVHRDLKSPNVVITPQGLVKVLDFGLARRVPDAANDTTATIARLDQPEVLTGTLRYMAPEILRGMPADARSDLWALGVVLYEAASGALPFDGQTWFEISSAILHETPAPLPSRIPAGLAAIVQRCLAKDPTARYQRASEIQAAIEATQSAAMSATQQQASRGGVMPMIVHRGIRHLGVKARDVMVMVGTTKGLFLLRSTPERSHWETAGPYFPGQPVYALAYDSRAQRHRIWASTHSLIWGSFLRSSDDFGRTWTNPVEANIKFPPDTGATLGKIWQIALGREEEPNVMYCGVDPAALFRSDDAGERWTLVRSLSEHAHHARWRPGNGGLCLHTIVPDPSRAERVYVAISVGGVYATNDGGATWQARNRGIRVAFAPEKYPEFGQCVHKIVMHARQPERLFLQNHWGLYRSDDGAETWHDIAVGVPSDFGFAMAMHPHNPDCVYILPVESDEFRCTPEGRLRVYRTRTAGASWEPLTRGLPQKGAHENVLRDAMTTDMFHPAGVYFGTRSGVLWGSIDEGRSWRKVLEGLPPVVCVKSAQPGGPTAPRQAKPPSAKRPSKK